MLRLLEKELLFIYESSLGGLQCFGVCITAYGVLRT